MITQVYKCTDTVASSCMPFTVDMSPLSLWIATTLATLRFALAAQRATLQ
jgi:hypothetical protein